MPGCGYDDPCDRPYGPGNPDYEHERRRDEREAEFVDAAMRDLLAGKFDTPAVHEVMSRRAGTMDEYVKAKDLRDAAVLAARHSGTA